MPPARSYHEATYRLLGQEPQTSAAATSKLQAAEKRLGVSFPAAVREWFSLSKGIGLLGKYSNRDHPIDVADWELTEHDGQSRVKFKAENQGVCDWSFVLDGSDDPPVLVQIDEDEPIVTAPKFSTYIYACVWDYSQVMESPCLVQANINPLTAQTLATLHQNFAAQPSTFGWPGDLQHRFAGEDVTILLWASKRQTDWFVSARSLEQLETGLRRIWHCDQVGPQFYSCGGEDAEEVLARLRVELQRAR